MTELPSARLKAVNHSALPQHLSAEPVPNGARRRSLEYLELEIFVGVKTTFAKKQQRPLKKPAFISVSPRRKEYEILFSSGLNTFSLYPEQIVKDQHIVMGVLGVGVSLKRAQIIAL